MSINRTVAYTLYLEACDAEKAAAATYDAAQTAMMAAQRFGSETIYEACTAAYMAAFKGLTEAYKVTAAARRNYERTL